MFDHVAVTSFSPRGWEVYGKKFVDSFLQHWDIPLLCYHESQQQPFRHQRLYWFNLDYDSDRAAFIKRNSTPVKIGVRTDPNEQSIRFCHKVFAITNHEIESRWRIWIDADVVTHHAVNEDALADLCPENASLAFLGRTQALWTGQKPYPECGFVAYRTEDERVQAMLSRMRSLYVTDELYKLGPHCQHDSYVFDYCRQQSGIPPQEQANLSAGLDGLHVWPRTVLGKFMTHAKGELRKHEAYGTGIV